MVFRDITENDKGELERRVRRFGLPNCDFAFANLMAWNGSYQATMCETDGFIVLRYFDDAMGYAYSMPLGEGDYSRVLSDMEEDAEGRGEHFQIYALRQEDIGYLRRRYPDFGFHYLRERSEYLYRREALASLSGKKLQQKRNHANKFHSLYNAEYSPLEASDCSQCLALMTRWRDGKVSDGILPDHYLEELDDEFESISFAFSHFDELGLMGGMLRINGKIAAFCYGSRISDEIFCTHVEKADEQYEGIFAVINQEFARHLPEDVIYIDREDDLGIQGLRRSKESYHPAYLLHKYIGSSLTPLQVQIRRLWLECFPEDSPLDAELFLKTRFKKDNMLAEYSDGELVSMLHIVRFSDTAYFYAIATDVRFRHRGLAEKLIRSALERCRKQGYIRAVLIPDSEHLAEWYERMGFRGHCRVHFHTGDEFDFFAICSDNYDFGTGDESRDFAMVFNLSDNAPEIGDEIILSE